MMALTQSIDNMTIDDLLRPIHFSWDEEFENAQTSGEGSAPETLMKVVESKPAISSGQETETLQSTSQRPGGGKKVGMVIDGSNTPTGPPKPPTVDPKYDPALYGYMTQAVQDEFKYREKLLKNVGGDKVHHFNWHGSAVYRHSSTPPEVSLWFMLTPPKYPIPNSSDEYRVRVTLRRAITYIDPVLLFLEKGCDIPLYPTTALLDFAKDRTSKLYTPHGWWQADIQERHNRSFTDDGLPEVYLDEEMRVGNGFIEGTVIMTKYAWEDLKTQLQMWEHQHRQRTMKRKVRESPEVERTKRRAPSPLRHSITISELDDIVDSSQPVESIPDLSIARHACDETPLPSMDSPNVEAGADAWISSPVQQYSLPKQPQPIPENEPHIMTLTVSPTYLSDDSTDESDIDTFSLSSLSSAFSDDESEEDGLFFS